MHGERLTVKYPKKRNNCWAWCLETVLGEWLGLQFDAVVHDESYVLIELHGLCLRIDSPFLSQSENDWRSFGLKPSLPLKEWMLPRTFSDLNNGCVSVPVLFGESGFFVDAHRSGYLKLDVFGVLFFLLSRYEEVVTKASDQHDRFPGRESLAHRAGFLERPLADEYTEVLWYSIKTIWPSLNRKCAPRRLAVSCDVDEPYERWIRGPGWLFKGLAGALVRRRSLAVAVRRINNYYASRREDFSYDPNWTFDWYMDLCEKYGIRAEFYFIASSGKRSVDGAYDIFEPRIINLLRNIDQRGHLIGLHGSYDTYRDSSRLIKEKRRLQTACEQANVRAELVNCRQHFLRWRAEVTPDCLSSVGFKFDSSGGYADLAGFRFGTTREFNMWSWTKMAPLIIRQKPLVLMEGTVLDSMGISNIDEAYHYISRLESRSLSNSGNFMLLWHNSYLQSPTHKKLFENVISLFQ